MIKNTWGPNYRSACELDQCILNAEFAHNTGILPFECCHVKSLSFCKLVDNPNVALTENSLSQLVQQKWFGEARKAQLLKLQQEAILQRHLCLFMSLLEVHQQSILYQYLNQQCPITAGWEESWWLIIKRKITGIVLVPGLANHAFTKLQQSGIFFR